MLSSLFGGLLARLVTSLLALLLGLFGLGCLGKITNTTLTVESIPPSVAKIHIEAPELVIEGHIDPIKGVKILFDAFFDIFNPSGDS